MPPFRNLPDPPLLSALLEAGQIALFCDFDGTLVELAPKPDSIQPRKDMVAALSALNDRLEGRFAMVSGRSIDDIEAHIGAVPFAIAGSHGAEKRLACGQPLGEPPRSVAADLVMAMRDFALERGANLEEKPHGLALHYRAKPELEPIVNQFADDAAEGHGLTAKRGKCVVELVEAGANKGVAANAFMAEAPFAGAVPWFIGDDVTDEDGFRACINHGGGAILVGERENSCATHALPSVVAVHEWLEFE